MPMLTLYISPTGDGSPLAVTWFAVLLPFHQEGVADVRAGYHGRQAPLRIFRNVKSHRQTPSQARPYVFQMPRIGLFEGVVVVQGCAAVKAVLPILVVKEMEVPPEPEERADQWQRQPRLLQRRQPASLERAKLRRLAELDPNGCSDLSPRPCVSFLTFTGEG